MKKNYKKKKIYIYIRNLSKMDLLEDVKMSLLNFNFL